MHTPLLWFISNYYISLSKLHEVLKQMRLFTFVCTNGMNGKNIICSWIWYPAKDIIKIKERCMYNKIKERCM